MIVVEKPCKRQANSALLLRTVLIKFVQKAAMSAQPLDIEFSKYWSRLTPVQKQSLLSVIKSFVEEDLISVEDYNKELQEGEAQYQAGDYITQDEMLMLIEKW